MEFVDNVLCDVVAYDDRQKAKRESIISRPLFSSSSKSALSLTPASAVTASTASSSSSSSGASLAAVKLATAASRVRRTTSCGGRAPRRQSDLLHSASSADTRRKLTESRKSIVGVKRRASNTEPPCRRPSDTSTLLHLQSDSAHDDHSNAAASSIADVDDAQKLASSCVVRDSCSQTPGALSLVSNYHSSSSSSNDSD